MSESSSKSKTAIIVAVIMGVFGCIAAVIGLGQPIVSRLVDIYLPAATPTPVLVQEQTTQPPTTTQPIDTPAPVLIQPTYEPEPQLIDWEPGDDVRETGICVDDCAEFIPWVEAKEELQQRVLPQVPNIPTGSTLTLKDVQGKQNWIIQVIDLSGNEVGNVWIGNDPLDNWDFDGLVRVGSPSAPVVVWGTFQRYSDGSYHKQ